VSAYDTDFVAWESGCIFLSRRRPGAASTVVPMHAHYALQIAFGPSPGIRFRSSEREEWTTYWGAIIPSRQPHTMDTSQVESAAILFVEPETHEGRALTERQLRGGITALPEEVLADAAGRLFTSWKCEGTASAISTAARQLVQELTGNVRPSAVSDERILRAIAYIRTHLDRALTLDEVAAEACLSPSRFRHLFVDETGIGLRPYILWRRFLRVWELLTGGASLSAAAHAAGFADAAHLSRTSRSMFGIPPSTMQIAALRRGEASGTARYGLGVSGDR